MGYLVAMRLHITLDDALVGDLDRVVGARERSSFISKAVHRAIEELDRSEALATALGSISDSGHDWDADPAGWVRVEEIIRELRPSEQPAADALFTAVRVLPIREPDARRAGAWRREHAARGITLHQTACLIGAVAAGIGAHLATGNTKHFPMPEVTVEEWPPRNVSAVAVETTELSSTPGVLSQGEGRPVLG
ncbi:MAG: hypothetical protein ACRDQ4_22785 [Pseudonocardiaceae bacterium]